MQTGALIVAAGMSSRMNSFKPLLKIGSISMIHRIIQTFEQAGITLIVLITGNKAEILENHVASKNVICLRNENYEHSDMLESAKIGLRFLEDKCEQVLFTPVDIPLFTKNTVEGLIRCNAKLASPICQGKKGHPLLIHTTLVPKILKYHGDSGLKGAINEDSWQLTLVEVEDQGILRDANTEEDFKELLKLHDSVVTRA